MRVWPPPHRVRILNDSFKKEITKLDPAKDDFDHAAGVEAENSEVDVAGLAASPGFSCAGAALGLGAKMFANGF